MLVMAENDGKMKGWLYIIRFNRFGLQYSRKRYFILDENCLKSFKSVPKSEKEEPIRSAIIDSCVRVVDNGRESHHRKSFFIFTLYNTTNHNDQLKLGATSSEETAGWIRALQDSAINPVENLLSCSKRKWQPFRMVNERSMGRCGDGMSASSVDAMTSDVIGPSPWKIFGCENGLRLFKEAKDRDISGRHWDDHPAIMVVGTVDGPSESVFRTVTSLGASRSEWDFCFYRGCVVEHLDGHTDIIHIELYNHWLPWSAKRRDLLMRRYWRREDDGTYVILYHSVVHRKCPPQDGYVRAILKSGGFVITPTKNGKGCVVKHMLAIDWRFWKPYSRKSSARSVTIRMLGRVSALIELFKAQRGNSNEEVISSGELSVDIGVLLEPQHEEIKQEVSQKKTHYMSEEEVSRQLSEVSSLTGLNDAADEFFDVPEPSDDEVLDDGWNSNVSSELHYVDMYPQKVSSAANFVKKLHDLAANKKGYMDLNEITREESVSHSYGATLPKDSTFNMPCSWAAADPSSFLIRGDNYLRDSQKIKANGTLMQMVAADWLKSDQREDDLAGRNLGLVQKHAAQGGSEFFFVINMQVPGTTTYNLALYYMLNSPLEENPLLDRFVNGDDAFRNSRFKLIPYISKGSWIVKQSVGKKAGLVGQALDIHYFRGKNYLELDIDVGSSTVARGVVNLVLGYLNNLVIEMAFLIQGNTPEELPEFLLGTCRLNHLDATKSISTASIPTS